MRGKIGLASFALFLLSVSLAQADPLQIRGAWVAPVANWFSMWLQKKDLAHHFGQSYTFEATHFAGTPPMITAIANNELEIGDLAYSTLPIAISNAGHGRHPRHRRRIPGRRSRLSRRRVRGPCRRPDQESRGPQGQDRCDECDRQRRRRRHARDATQTRARSQPRLHDRRSAVPGDEGDAGGEEGRSNSRPCCRLRSIRNSRRSRGRCSRFTTRLAYPSSLSGPRASRSSTRIALRSSTFLRIRCASSAGISTRKITMQPRRSLRS